ncbi:MAG: nucleotidyltransferase family protein, partial [Clostridia bacterium]|nr:nucleotidyltransferase family protein [Clostridia bacterium]
MANSKTAAQLIEIIGAVIKGIKPDISGQDINWYELYALAMAHSVANILAYAADETTPDAVCNELAKQSALAFARCSAYEYETQRICAEFEKRNIAYMPLKGYIMREYYPSLEMRTMCDIDILIKGEEIEDVHEVMTVLGFECKERYYEREDVVTYDKLPLCSYEMHKQLVSSSHTVIDAYYGDGWGFAKRVGESSCHRMSDEDFF